MYLRRLSPSPAYAHASHSRAVPQTGAPRAPLRAPARAARTRRPLEAASRAPEMRRARVHANAQIVRARACGVSRVRSAPGSARAPRRTPPRAPSLRAPSLRARTDTLAQVPAPQARTRRSMYRNKGRGHKSRQPRKEPEDELPDTSPPIGLADAAAAATKVYLVKMPNFLYEKFSQPVPDGAPPPVLGRLRIPAGAAAGAGPAPQLFLDGATGGPDAYTLRFNDNEPHIYVFSEAPADEQPGLKVEGSVSYQCSAQPALDARYRGVQRARTRSAATKTRTTQFIDDETRRVADNSALRPNAFVETARQREERKRSKEAARRHLDVPDAEWRNLAKLAIFKAFELKPHYAAEQLARDVDEPLSRLRSVINELCVYNKSGPFAGRYELKDEFKTADQRAEKLRHVEEHKQKMFEKARRMRDERAEQERQEGRSSKRPRMS